jgi:site-specific DNA-adenine methylase
MHLLLKWPGGKFSMALRIFRLLPLHPHSVEPFLEGGAL